MYKTFCFQLLVILRLAFLLQDLAFLVLPQFPKADPASPQKWSWSLTASPVNESKQQLHQYFCWESLCLYASNSNLKVDSNLIVVYMKELPWWFSTKESTCNAGDVGLIPWLGRSPGGGNGNPLQYACLKNPMDRGAWWATVHRVAQSQTWLSDWAQYIWKVNLWRLWLRI